ncbi:hypothetical protein MMC09_006618 [Bachmanniomyces sp. S44760]|nr:hypothetical protein [Bachmanniomyces sp. S44760]
MAGSGNRKARRNQAKVDNESSQNIPMSVPSRDVPKQKTLYEIAAERQLDLQSGQPFTQSSNIDSRAEPSITTAAINPDGTLSTGNGKVEKYLQPDDEPIGPMGQALFYSLTLLMLHFTLDVLVHHQYRQEIGWGMIVQRTLTTLPMILGLVYFLHQRSSQLWVQMFFLTLSVGAGCYLIYSSNEEAYFAVMKRAPPLGTLWVWSVMELRLEIAVAGLLAVGGYYWKRGYTIF